MKKGRGILCQLVYVVLVSNLKGVFESVYKFAVIKCMRNTANKQREVSLRPAHRQRVKKNTPGRAKGGGGVSACSSNWRYEKKMSANLRGRTIDRRARKGGKGECLA